MSISPNIANQVNALSLNWGNAFGQPSMGLMAAPPAEPSNAITAGIDAFAQRPANDAPVEAFIKGADMVGDAIVQGIGDKFGGAIAMAGGGTKLNLSSGAHVGFSASPVSASYDPDHSQAPAPVPAAEKTANTISAITINLNDFFVGHSQEIAASPTGKTAVAPRAVAGPIRSFDMQMGMAA